MSLELLRDPSKRGNKPLLCLEVNPPRGVDLEPIYERLTGALAGVDLLNVTDSALARMKLAALPFAALLKQRYSIDVVVNVSCRDRNLIALQSDLLAGWAMGVRSIVALTGDAVTVGDDPERKGVFEVNSIGLLHAIETLNSGKDLAGNQLHGKPALIPGVVVNPNAKNRNAELKRLRRKKDAGATYALSQPVFDVELATAFLTESQEVGIPIMLGLLPFKNAHSAEMLNNIPGIKFPDQLLAEVQKYGDQDLSQLSIDHCLKIAEATTGLAAGFHVVSGATAKLGIRLCQALAATVCKPR